MVRTRSRRHHRRRNKSPISAVSLPATLLGVAVLAYFAVQLATNPTASTSKRIIVHRPVTTEISTSIPDNQLSKAQPPQLPLKSFSDQAQAQADASNEQPPTQRAPNTNKREQSGTGNSDSAPHAPIAHDVDVSSPTPPAAPVVPSVALPPATDADEDDTPPQSAGDVVKQDPAPAPDVVPVSAPIALDTTGETYAATPDSPTALPPMPAATTGSGTRQNSQSAPPGTASQANSATSPTAPVPESKLDASEVKSRAHQEPVEVKAANVPVLVGAAPEAKPATYAMAQAVKATKPRGQQYLITSPLAMDVRKSPATAPAAASEAKLGTEIKVKQTVSRTGNVANPNTNTITATVGSSAVAQADTSKESTTTENNNGEKGEARGVTGGSSRNRTNEAEVQGESGNKVRSGQVGSDGESEDESATTKIAHKTLADGGSGSKKDQSLARAESEETETQTGVTAMGTKNHNVSHASVEVKHGNYTLQVPRGARVTGKLPDFMGVVPQHGGIVRGMNVTRVSYALYKIIKLFGFSSVIDTPAGAHTDWMGEMLTRVEFDRPAFKYIGIDSNCTALAAAKEAVGVMGNADFKCVDVTDEGLPSGYDVVFYWPDLNTGGERDPTNAQYARHIESVMKNAKLHNNSYIVVPQYPSQKKPVRYRYGRWVFDTDGEDGAPFVMNEHMKGVVPVELKQKTDSYLLYLTFYSLFQMQFY